ncbi:AAA family ATPase [Flavobacterium sp. J49]|uniref:shikimate kinase n=1 Tax=Flavobacterium sp. J49 TaxID=2718534 RepID=UPI001592CE72|nr:shikimate kinase [Flavobacterium sp. J49]MBF6642269.1 AAA family ATPase [Flavobacterium sp. J49]NIC03515.1 AAA family ATPase [Flavobacterium sp. J49]
MQKIILVGYMAVGKSTIGKILAEKRQMKWVDLDKIIENNANLSIADIFALKGEIYFRKQEHLEFEKLINTQENLVISTGGGTPCYANNHLLLNGDEVVSIYLNATIDQLYLRLKNNTAERPLVANQTEEELKEFIAKNLFDRSYYYNQATFKINTDGKTPEAIAAEIEALLN